MSVHVVRDYLLRGLLRPAARIAGGYGVFDADAMQRLCFVRTAFEAGISRVSASQVGPDFGEQVRRALTDAGLSADHLEIELTESVAFGDPAIS